jgi:tetratricopeptide (TPR) repeat protein
VRKNQARRLILDLRWNGGGNNYLLKPLIVSIIQMPGINRRGNFVVLTSPRTFSACQNLVNRLENLTEALFIGEPTGENVNFYGDTRAFVLPNSGCRVVLANLWWQDKDPRDRRAATFPEIAIEETFDDYVQNRDPVLDYVLRHEAIPTIEETILEGLKRGGYGTAKEAFRRFRSDPERRYLENDIVEGKVNNLGYALMGEKRLEEALEVLKLNTEEFPASFNTWDSLGEAYANAGRKDEAIAAYQKSLELNPTSTSGLDALSRLRK